MQVKFWSRYCIVYVYNIKKANINHDQILLAKSFGQPSLISQLADGIEQQGLREVKRFAVETDRYLRLFNCPEV